MTIHNYNIIQNTIAEVDNSVLNPDFSEYIDFKDNFQKRKLLCVIAGISVNLLMPCVLNAKDIPLQKNTNDMEIFKQYNNEYSYMNNNYIDILKKNEKRLTKKTNFNELLTNILSFQSLENSWDGYGAFPLQNKSGVNSLAIIEKMGESIYSQISDYYPNPSGTLSIEWENNNKTLGLEIGNEEFSYYLTISDSEKSYFNKQSIYDNNILILKSNISKVLI